ncbi:ASCH domain-containing protein [Serratia liquefaciens]|uniref:morphogenetic protein n=1 Tax=Serratia liquefaciens TaxID=614 RepID=UPI0021C97D36|nr:morphogenetic protein [Serratia liquefaciens]
MKERPVIFNGEMVRAILDGRKTQTRRAISDRHLHLIDVASQVGECYPLESGIDHANSQSYYREHCPFGQVGDRLWVREAYQGPLFNFDQMETYLEDTSKFERPEFCEYRADGGRTPEYYDADDNLRHGWKPSIHMPRWASRILLEITAVRVERLNDISEADAINEGIDADSLAESQDNYDCIADHNMTGRPTAKGHFSDLWQSIYGEESWAANPWVWVIEFKRVEVRDASK